MKISFLNCLVVDVDVCRNCLEKQNNVLHPLSIYRTQTLDLALDGCIQYQFWEQAEHYANLLLPGFRFDNIKQIFRDKVAIINIFKFVIGIITVKDIRCMVYFL